MHRSEQVKLLVMKIKQFKQYGESRSVINPIVRSHTENLSCLFTIGDTNNHLGSMHGEERPHDR